MKNQEIRKSGKKSEIPNKELSGAVIESAIQVHRSLGPGFLESFYEEALCIELSERCIKFERQKTLDVEYRGKSIGKHRVDLLVDRSLVVESGLILNFATMPLSVKRVGPHTPSAPDFLIS
jgi:hypothetical protein